MKFVLSCLLLWVIAGCATVDTWKLDDPAADTPSLRRLEERMDRFIHMLDLEGETRNWYVVNGYYLLVKTPFYLRSAIRARVPYVACDGADNDTPEKIEKACLLLRVPLTDSLKSE